MHPSINTTYVHEHTDLPPQRGAAPAGRAADRDRVQLRGGALAGGLGLLRAHLQAAARGWPRGGGACVRACVRWWLVVVWSASAPDCPCSDVCFFFNHRLTDQHPPRPHWTIRTRCRRARRRCPTRWWTRGTRTWRCASTAASSSTPSAAPSTPRYVCMCMFALPRVGGHV